MIHFILATMLILTFVIDIKEKIMIASGTNIVFWAKRLAQQLRASTSLKRDKVCFPATTW